MPPSRLRNSQWLQVHGPAHRNVRGAARAMPPPASTYNTVLAAYRETHLPTPKARVKAEAKDRALDALMLVAAARGETCGKARGPL